MIQDLLTFAIVDLVFCLLFLFFASVVAFVHDEFINQANQDYRRINRFIGSVQLALDELNPTWATELA